MTRASTVLGALLYRVQAAIYLGSPKEGSGKRLKTMGAFRSSLSTQRRREEQREGSNTQGKGNHFLIHSKNKDCDQRINCWSYSRKKATTGLPAFLSFHARLSSPPIIPTPQLLGTIELCLWYAWSCRSWPYLTRTFILHRLYRAPQNALCVTVPFSPPPLTLI